MEQHYIRDWILFL